MNSHLEAQNDPELEKNLKALKRLRDLPRGTEIDSRITAIQSLLQDKEIFRTLHSLRWPEGVVCPRCGSTHIVKHEPLIYETQNHRWFFECLYCKAQGEESTFNDLTGLPFEGSISALREWVLCWYLLGFCSVHQISKVLGISIALVIELAQMGANITVLPKKEDILSYTFLQNTSKKRAEGFFKKRQEQTLQDELFSRSESVGKFKPGPKSKL